MISPTQQEQAITLRLAGYSISSVSEQTNISISALKVLYAKTGVKRSIKKELVDKARLKLISNSTFEKSIKLKIAISLDEDLAIASKMRDVVAFLLEEIEMDTTQPLQVKCRSIAALATTLGLTQTVIRKTLSIDKFQEDVKQEKLTVLEIRGMTAAETEAIIKNANSQSFDVVDLSEETIEEGG
jgi:hypothetical protein